MRTFNQRRQVLVNEDVYRQPLSQAQIPGQAQMLVPRQEAVPNEYTIIDEGSIRDDELAGCIDGASEIDFNRNRNEIPRGTFGTDTMH
jgi:hypothetical protein